MFPELVSYNEAACVTLYIVARLRLLKYMKRLHPRLSRLLTAAIMLYTCRYIAYEHSVVVNPDGSDVIEQDANAARLKLVDQVSFDSAI